MPASTLLAGIGSRLVRYGLDVDAGTLAEQCALDLPGRVQAGAVDAAGETLHLLTGGPSEPEHHLHAIAVGGAHEGLRPRGEALRLPHRAIAVALHPDGRHLLCCFVEPARVSVHPIGPDGAAGAAASQSADLDFGEVGHDVVFGPGVPPLVLTAARGHDATAGQPERPGALKQFHLLDGRLCQLDSVAPNQGYGFGPRNMAFHPSGRWLFVSLERQNAVQVFAVRGGRVAEPTDMATTLQFPRDVKPRQYTGAVRVHPAGHAVYVANRCEGTVERDGERIFNGGENTIAVFTFDATAGKLRLLQHAETHCMHPRSFQLDPGGRHVFVAGLRPRLVRSDGSTRVVGAGVSVLDVRSDGSLAWRRKHDVDVGREMFFWMDAPPSLQHASVPPRGDRHEQASQSRAGQ